MFVIFCQDYLACVNNSYVCDGICDCPGCEEENKTWCGDRMKCFYEDEIICPVDGELAGVKL